MFGHSSGVGFDAGPCAGIGSVRLKGIPVRDGPEMTLKQKGLYRLPLLLLVASAVVLLCVLFNRVTSRLGIPMLAAFILLGMLFGSDGIFKIPFEDFFFAEQICSFALIFIMFYGGFGTKWASARPVAGKAVLLSTLGVALTAGLTALFCWFALGFPVLVSVLLGSVISSTDAASVFSILRSKKLDLKDGTASLLEVESGSNDPMSYMLTASALTLLRGQASAGALLYLVFSQIVYGVLIGLAVALAARHVFRNFQFAASGFDAAFLIAVAMAAYALPTLVGGNGYLSAYLAGIVLGNSHLPGKRTLVHFFDGVTGLMQMAIFFLLGLVATPSLLPGILFPALAIALFLTFVARPAAVFALLAPFGCTRGQMLLVSWSGLRGAASIVFAIMSINSGVIRDVFNIVFCVVLLSILIQGTLIPAVSRRLNMIDENADVLTTFTDYTDEVDLQFVKLKIRKGHPWKDQHLRDLQLPPELLVVLLLRGGAHLVPDGATAVQEGDVLVLCAPAFQDETVIRLSELTVKPGSKWIGQRISSIRNEVGSLVIMIQRGGKTIVPNGQTILRESDVLVLNQTAQSACS